MTDDTFVVLVADDHFDPAAAQVGVELLRQAAAPIASAFGDMMAAGRDPRRHCVMVCPALGLPGAPRPPEGQEPFAVAELPREEAAAAFEAARPDIARGIRSHPTRPGYGLVVVTWSQGTQLHQHELAPTARGGRA